MIRSVNGLRRTELLSSRRMALWFVVTSGLYCQSLTALLRTYAGVRLNGYSDNQNGWSEPIIIMAHSFGYLFFPNWSTALATHGTRVHTAQYWNAVTQPTWVTQNNMNRKRYWTLAQRADTAAAQSSGTVWKPRWTSWAPRVPPNKPTVSVDVKQHFNHCC